MSELSRHLALDHYRVYKPSDIVHMFKKFYDDGSINDNECMKYDAVSSQYLINEWKDKGCQDILAITYMCANNILPMILKFSRQADHQNFQSAIKYFIIYPFQALETYYLFPSFYLKRLGTIHNIITKDFYWSNILSSLDEQIIYVLDEFNYQRIF